MIDHITGEIVLADAAGAVRLSRPGARAVPRPSLRDHDPGRRLSGSLPQEAVVPLPDGDRLAPALPARQVHPAERRPQRLCRRGLRADRCVLRLERGPDRGLFRHLHCGARGLRCDPLGRIPRPVLPGHSCSVQPGVQRQPAPARASAPGPQGHHAPERTPCHEDRLHLRHLQSLVRCRGHGPGAVPHPLRHRPQGARGGAPGHSLPADAAGLPADDPADRPGPRPRDHRRRGAQRLRAGGSHHPAERDGEGQAVGRGGRAARRPSRPRLRRLPRGGPRSRAGRAGPP